MPVRVRRTCTAVTDLPVFRRSLRESPIFLRDQGFSETRFVSFLPEKKNVCFSRSRRRAFFSRLFPTAVTGAPGVRQCDIENAARGRRGYRVVAGKRFCEGVEYREIGGCGGAR